ncbi:MAG: hypothetical protein KGM24_04410 [Elusimicrobia bacterium]|nr:hypothetical protein [Elusimicrobiota bacterium]
MERIAPGLWHWSARHAGIGARVHSYYWEPAGMLIDPMLPREGLAWFRRRPLPPKVIVLTNRHHLRHGGYFRKAFPAPVFCHRAGLHEFPRAAGVRGFAHGATLPGGAKALKVASLCPEETALALPGGILALGDSVVRAGRGLAFVPDAYMGPKPAAVKRGLRAALTRLSRRPFKHLLLAHGAPFVGDGREVLRAFVAAPPRQPGQ